MIISLLFINCKKKWTYFIHFITHFCYIIFDWINTLFSHTIHQLYFIYDTLVEEKKLKTEVLYQKRLKNDAWIYEHKNYTCITLYYYSWIILLKYKNHKRLYY